MILGSFFGLDNLVLDLLLFNRRRTRGAGGSGSKASLYDWSDQSGDGSLLLDDVTQDKLKYE